MPSSAATPRTTLRERHTALTRSVVLDVARRQFAERGFAAAAVRPIAQEAGISLQTLYSTFGSKQGLLLALVDTVREQTGGPEAREHVMLAEHADELIERAANLRRRILEECGDIIVTFREGAAGDADVAEAYEAGQRRMREGLDRMCGRLQELGALRPELTRRKAADQMAALFVAEIYEELTGPRSAWSPDEYELWLRDRLRGALLDPAR
jgi:TetR/AcrR family transcriptional regulator, regulator of cefoperazone and chloramphenicol sensitivity